jgi:hypothetical protein
MQKLQVLFPAPTLARLRAFAEQEDRPVSELIRRAVDRLLETKSPPPRRAPALPTFAGGKVLVGSADLKKAIYADDEL